MMIETPFIEDQVVDLVFDAIGSMTMDELCQPGIRDKVAERICASLLDAMDAQFEKKRIALGWKR